MAAMSKWKGLLHKVFLNRPLTYNIKPFSTSSTQHFANRKGDDKIPEFIPTSPDELEEQDQPLGGQHFSPPSDEQMKKAQELFDTLLKGSGTVDSSGKQALLYTKPTKDSGNTSPDQLSKAKELFESFDKGAGDEPSDITSQELTADQIDSHTPTQSQIVRAQQLFENLSGMLIKSEATPEPEVEYNSFASMLRKSSYIGLGNPRGSNVKGKIFDVIDDDLYIDFGGKFHAVCKVPPVYLKRGLGNQGLYGRGKEVHMRINQLEMASRFLDGPKDITLLEANCTLMGPLKRK